MTKAQPEAARKNVRKAAKAAKQKRSLAHLPEQDQDCLGQAGCGGRTAQAHRRKRAEDATRTV
jgi:hypothetical protein